ncbi:unnamed protein product, partial [Ectocarpus fasciculatus]
MNTSTRSTCPTPADSIATNNSGLTTPFMTDHAVLFICPAAVGKTSNTYYFFALHANQIHEYTSSAAAILTRLPWSKRDLYLQYTPVRTTHTREPPRAARVRLGHYRAPCRYRHKFPREVGTGADRVSLRSDDLVIVVHGRKLGDLFGSCLTGEEP